MRKRRLRSAIALGAINVLREASAAITEMYESSVRSEDDSES
jgi:hypothetical protein